MEIYTRRGDQGKTVLLDGCKLSKDHPRIHAMGDIDEINSFLGLIKAQTKNSLIETIQEKLFEIGAELGNYKLIGLIKDKDWKELELIIDKESKKLPEIRHFVYSGKSKNSALFDVARTICRRAERSFVKYKKSGKHNANSLIYLNRVSSLLYILARKETMKAKKKEEYWTLKQ